MAARLIRERAELRGGRGSGPRYGHPPTFTGHGSSKKPAGGDTGPVSMSAAMSAMVDGRVDVSASATEAPTEMQTSDFEQWAEAHNDLWTDPESHVVLTIDSRRHKVVALPVKLTMASVTDTSTASRAIPEPDLTKPIEFAQLNRRSMGGLFPAAWGSVPMEPETRHAWILEHCRKDAAGDVAKLIELRAKYRVLAILARRFGPNEI